MLVVVVFNGLKFNQIYDFLSNELLFIFFLKIETTFIIYSK